MVGTISDWRDELGRWLKPFLHRLGHKARRRMCPLYVSGLIGPGDRKSSQPMAERLAVGDYDQLHHCRRARSLWLPIHTRQGIACLRNLRRGSGCGCVRQRGAGCCARAAIGHAVAPPSSVINSRRVGGSNCIRCP
jgi:hypothetical protein